MQCWQVCCSGSPKFEDCVPLRCNPVVMLKPICRLARFFKFLLSFRSLLRIFSGCNAALNRLVSLWRYTIDATHKASAFNLGSPPHIRCANDPTQPHRAIDMVPPHPSGDDPRTQATVPEAQQLNQDLPLSSGGGPAPAPVSTQVQARSSVLEDPYFSTFEDPVWNVGPGVADGKIRYIQRTIDKDKDAPDENMSHSTSSKSREDPRNFVIPAGKQSLTYASGFVLTSMTDC